MPGKNKIAVITSPNNGTGLATARELHQLGGRVVIIGRALAADGGRSPF